MRIAVRVMSRVAATGMDRKKALRLASRLISAGGTTGLDMLARLQTLEGAAGVPMNGWARNGSKSAVQKGLLIAREELPEAHDSWFGADNTNYYKSALRAADQALRNNPEMSPEDLVQSLMIGMSMSTGKKITNIFRAAGDSMERTIRNGRSTTDLVGGKVYELIAAKAGGIAKRYTRRQDILHEQLDAGNALGFRDRSPRDQTKLLIDALVAHRDPRAQKLYQWIEDFTGQFGTERESQIIRLFMDKIRAGAAHGVNKALALEMDLSDAMISKTIKKFVERASKAVKKDRQMREIMDSYAIESMGPRKYASNQSTKSSDMNLRNQLIRLAHTNPELRGDLLPLIKACDCEKEEEE